VTDCKVCGQPLYGPDEGVAQTIREFFLRNGKWELDAEGWLWLSDANTGFDPIELVRELKHDPA
jgi:hypothetical protein